MCLYPKIIDNPKYKANKKNGGNIPPVLDDRVKKVAIGCKRCIECMNQIKRNWQLRLSEDIKEHTNGKFVTLTFSDESILELWKKLKEKNQNQKEQLKGYELDNAIATLAMRRFLERWRKEFGKSLRHWFVSELGHTGTENIHLHGIIFTDIKVLENTLLEDIWQYGHVWKGSRERGKLNNYVNAKTINYLIKYVHKIDFDHRGYKPIMLTSAGIGRNYTNSWNSNRNKYNGINTDVTYRTDSGYKMAMPIYWRNKIYSEEEREQLWLYMLDKQVRYVCGEKVDISKDYKAYDRLVEHYREMNKELGYGSDEKNYDREQYERERRILKQKERMQRAVINNLRKSASPAGQ